MTHLGRGKTQASSKRRTTTAKPSGQSADIQGRARKQQDSLENEGEPVDSRRKSSQRALSYPEARPLLPSQPSPRRTRSKTLQENLDAFLARDDTIDETRSGSQRSPSPEKLVEDIPRDSRPEGNLERFLAEDSHVDPEELKKAISEEAQALVSSIDTVSTDTPDFWDPVRKAVAIVLRLREYGYEPSRNLEGMAEAGSTANFTKPIKEEVLEKSNVDIDEVEEPFAENIVEKLKPNIKKKSSKAMQEKESRWKDDLNKCNRSPEAVFQRTLMMKTLDRHNFKEMRADLDYTTELPWLSAPPPSRSDVR